MLGRILHMLRLFVMILLSGLSNNASLTKISMPNTSLGGPRLGLKIPQSRGREEKPRQKKGKEIRQKQKTLKREKNPPFRWGCVMAIFDYHAPQEHYLPEKNLPEYFFEITVTRFELFRINFKKVTRYPLYLCELHDITRLRPLSLSNYFLLPLPDLKYSELIG